MIDYILQVGLFAIKEQEILSEFVMLGATILEKIVVRVEGFVAGRGGIDIHENQLLAVT